MKAFISLVLLATTATAAIGDDCPGYIASNVEESDFGLTADLTLAGAPCDVYSEDLRDLKLVVEYQTRSRLHVIIQDADEQVYQIQESIVERPENRRVSWKDSDLRFELQKEPFWFKIVRHENEETLFDTSSSQLIFEAHYLRLRTSLPEDPNIYGFGEHSDRFRLRTDSSYRRTLWNCEAPFIPRESNLYGSQPMYLEHRISGSHGVLFMNSNGMDINLDRSVDGKHVIEYNTIGGVLDFYFFSGPTPTEVSKQHAEAIGFAAMMPYWSLGFHQAKYGYWDVNYLAEVVGNYSTAGIPLEVLWGDIDYMDLRKDFTTDPERFPMDKMRELVDTLHERKLRWVMMLDPGISTDSAYGSFTRGHEQGAFLRADDGSDYRGVQWAGEVVWPDYHSEEGHSWWIDEMERFFDRDSGMDVDGLWNDMNEVSNFCPDIYCNPKEHADNTDTPPDPANPPRNNTGRPIPGFPDSFQPDNEGNEKRRETTTTTGGDKKGLPDREWFEPPYAIRNLKGNLSDNTLWTNITNHDGTRQYDTHNLYGLTMAKTTYDGMTKRRLGKRPFVLTRSTFLSSSRWAAHWFGDNYSAWDDYRITIYQMLGYSAIHNYPMVGSDVCGFNGEAQENMCSRWAMLAAFQPFYRNHADISAPFQEFYWWDLVTRAARKAIDARYRLLDYIYTALYRATSTGVPSVNPLFFIYPSDEGTYGIDHQYFLGKDILINPVIEDESQSVAFYLPDDVFYDFWTHKSLRSHGQDMTLDNVGWDEIPVYIRGGAVIPMRSESASTTAELREQPFTLIIAPGLDGKAEGSVVLDDGESIDGGVSDVRFLWEDGTLQADGIFDYQSDLRVEKILILGEDEPVSIDGNWSLDNPFTVRV